MPDEPYSSQKSPTDSHKTLGIEMEKSTNKSTATKKQTKKSNPYHQYKPNYPKRKKLPVT